MTIPDPGGDEARAAGCECSPTANGAVHPIAGQPIEPHHGTTKKLSACFRDDQTGRWVCGWHIEPACPLHNSDAWAAQEGHA